MEKRRNCSLGAISPLFHNIFYLLLDFHVLAGTRFSLRDKRLFEINEFEITRVNCILPYMNSNEPDNIGRCLLPLHFKVIIQVRLVCKFIQLTLVIS